MNPTGYPAPNGGQYGAPQQYPSPPPRQSGGFSLRAKLTLGVSVLVVGILGGAYYAGVAQPVARASAPAASQVALETTSSAGDNPFLATPVGTDQAGVTAPQGAGGEFSGDTEGLFAEDGDRASCDAQTLVAGLQSDGTKAAAWAGALNITAAEIPDFVNGLNPVLLRADTAVTAHGYENDTFVPYPAVLQAGTAVFVNSFGEPTVKCYSGNPLTKAVDYTDATYAGEGWTGFDATHVTYVAAAPTVIRNYVHVDVHHGGKHYRKGWCDRHPDSKWCSHKNPDKWCDKRPDSKWCKDPKPGEWCSKHPHSEQCNGKPTNEEWCKMHPDVKGCHGKDERQGDKDKDDGDNKPGDNKPGDNKPGDNKPGGGNDAKPGEGAPPGTGEPAKTEPSKTEPSKTEPSKTEPGKTDPPATDGKPKDTGKDTAKGPVLVKEPVPLPKPEQANTAPVVKQPVKVLPKKESGGEKKQSSSGDSGPKSGDSGPKSGDSGSKSGDSGPKSGDSGSKSGDSGSKGDG